MKHNMLGGNSQHVLAIVGLRNDSHQIYKAFQKTSDLPCTFRRYGHVSLASNYPNCIIENDSIAVLCGGCAYGFHSVFPSETTTATTTLSSTPSSANAHAGTTWSSFASRIIQVLEPLLLRTPIPPHELAEFMRRELDPRFARVSGHFTVMICHKSTESLFLWNDPFGFMPLFFVLSSEESAVFSSSWDCVATAVASPTLDVDVVAEYIMLGATLGGGSPKQTEGARTFVRTVYNTWPGTSRWIRCNEAPRGAGNIVPASHETNTIISMTQYRYTRLYGACEFAELQACPSGGVWKTVSSERPDNKRCSHHTGMPLYPVQSRNEEQKRIRTNLTLFNSVQVEHPEAQRKRLDLLKYERFVKESSLSAATNDRDVSICSPSPMIRYAMYQAFCEATRNALNANAITHASLTGGGDTRFILSTLTREHQEGLIFQTHAKQQTDLSIARHICRKWRLKHQRRTVQQRNTYLPAQRELLLSLLHDQKPLQQRIRYARADRSKESISSCTLGGRFGTEFLGFLCFQKTSIPIRHGISDVDTMASQTSAMFRCVFQDCTNMGDKNSTKGDAETKQPGLLNHIQDPSETLRETLRYLEAERDEYRRLHSHEIMDARLRTANQISPNMDVAFAFQLQLFTRAFLCDVYGGLREASWFAMPFAYFLRNDVSPFLDSTFLRILICFVSNHAKQHPYELYAELYRDFVPEAYRRIPCNNKLLCMHADMPRALKATEKRIQSLRPHIIRSRGRFHDGKSRDSSTYLSSPIWKHGNDARRGAFEDLKAIFNPLFWEVAIAIMNRKLTTTTIHEIYSEAKPGLQKLMNDMGPEELTKFSGRLQSFLLWYERRFLPLVSS